MVSGVIIAALMTTNGPLARVDEACSVRAESSLPEPGAPRIITRALVGGHPLHGLAQLVHRHGPADEPARLA